MVHAGRDNAQYLYAVGLLAGDVVFLRHDAVCPAWSGMVPEETGAMDSVDLLRNCLGCSSTLHRQCGDPRPIALPVLHDDHLSWGWSLVVQHGER